MYYIVSTLKNNKTITETLNNQQINSKIFKITDIKESTSDNKDFQTSIKSKKIDGIILITDDIIKNMALIVFLMDIEKNMLVVIPSKADYLKNHKYQSILGVPIVHKIQNIEEQLKQKNFKNTIPHINNQIEEAIDLIKEILTSDDAVKRYIAMQIIYENPYYNSYLNNTKIKIIKEDLDYSLKNKTIDIIENSIKMIK